MTSITLLGYKIQVKENNNEKDLPNFDGKDDFFDFIQEYFKSNSNKSTDVVNADKKIITHPQSISVDLANRMISGLIELGDYGYEATLRDATSYKVSYKRKTTEAESLPFYFCFYIPKNKNGQNSFGIAVFQKFKQFGAKGAFQNQFTDQFNNKYPLLKLEMNFISPDVVLSEILKSRILDMKLTSYGIPSDLADVYDKGVNEDDLGTISLMYNHKRGRGLEVKSIISEMFSKKKIKGLVQLDGFDTKEVKVAVELDGSKKTFKITEDGMMLSPGLDVSGKIRFKKDGHPEFDSLDKVSKEYIQELRTYVEKQ